MFYLRLLTSQTCRHILTHLLLHSRPPEMKLQVLIHLCCSRMNTQSAFVAFVQDHLISGSFGTRTRPLHLRMSSFPTVNSGAFPCITRLRFSISSSSIFCFTLISSKSPL